ncbi:hypothetical protein [Chitinophaga nivalis]|uniref:Uncharacterized protein n=1 Tax=Chitinophaga nivalis TaxID=2991709 RepID=A0ABT3IPK9_9BACT|nr:hypothetical protein [Chitinophaga nivalis]MCW3464399.1 hypothetical protein [Chitinophaga nivalis]MCW3485910.1 hypothetical protein [Chitinophaga nivalis]
MSTLSLRSVMYAAFLACCISSCSKNATETTAVNVDAAKAGSTLRGGGQDPDGKSLAELFRSKGPQFETYNIDARQGGEIVSKKGTRYRLPPNSLIDASGATVYGPVTVSIKEIRDVSNMILADKPTVTTTGGQLYTYGEFFVRATQGTQDLRLKKDSAIVVQIQQVKPVGNFREVPMWGGDTTILVSLSGYNFINQYITITQQISANRGVEWRQNAGPNNQFALFNSSNGSLSFRLDSLLRWVNCDALYNGGNPKTTVLGYFTNFFNPATSTSYGGEEPSMLFFKPKNIPSLIKFYNVIFTPPPGKAGLLSYQNSVPVGQAGTFLAITALNGKLYAEQKDVVIPAPATGTNFVPISFNLVEVTQSDLLSLINSMNSK